MGWHFRRSKKIGGMRLNLGKRSAGISTGMRGFRVSSNTRSGTHLSLGIPGTGISYRQKIGGHKRRRKQHAQSPDDDSVYIGCIPTLVLVAGAVWVVKLLIPVALAVLRFALLIAPIVIAARLTQWVTNRSMALGKPLLTRWLDGGIIMVSGAIINVLWWLFLRGVW